MNDAEHPRTTPEGHTPEEPRPSELGEEGTPGAGRTADVPHAADAQDIEEGRQPPPVEAVGEAHTREHTGEHAEEDAVVVAHDDAGATVDSHAEPHLPADGHGAPDDEHAHAEPHLGPIDWAAWGYAALGVAIALVIVALFYVAIA